MFKGGVLVLLLCVLNSSGFLEQHVARVGLRRSAITDRDLEPEEWQKNREAAKARRLKFGRNEKIERRRTLLAAQQQFRKQMRRKPAYREFQYELDQLQVGEWFDGTVRKLRPQGAYVSIGTEIDGFVHVKDLREDEFVRRAEDVLFLGQEIRVCIKAVDPSTKKLSLSAIALDCTLLSDSKPLSSFTLNQRITDARIMRVTPYAAFVDIGASIPAYLHVTDVGLLPRTRIGAPRVPRVHLEVGNVIPEAWISFLDPSSSRGLRISCFTPEERALPEKALNEEEEAAIIDDLNLDIFAESPSSQTSKQEEDSSTMTS